MLDNDIGESSTNMNGSSDKQPSMPHCISKWCRCGKRFEYCLQQWFYRWGMFCANHPSVIIITSLIVCAALSAGLSKFKVSSYSY